MSLVSDSVQGPAADVPDHGCEQRLCIHLDPAIDHKISGSTTLRNVKTRWCGVQVLALLLAVLGVVGCSDGGTEASPEDETTTTAATATTEPQATDEASHEVVRDMVLEATDLADELFQDPELVDDPDSDAMDRLREIYTDDSPTPDGVETQLHEMAAQGQHERAAGNGMFREVSVYSFEPVDENTLRFDTCSQIDTELVDAEGNVISTEAAIRFSRGEARRVEGVWRFYGLSNDDSRVTEIEPGGASPRFCARAADAASEAS